MPFFVYGRDPDTGQVMPRFLSDASTAEEARSHGNSHGMKVSDVVAYEEQSHPPVPFAIARSREEAAEGTRQAIAIDEDVAEFRHRLEELTPRTYGTHLLIAINLAVFVLMVIDGVSFNKPQVKDMISWGAEFGPKTLEGEWWRLLTSMFVHIGFLHVALNMLALAVVGPTVERLVGRVSFLVIYLVSGLGGSVLALYTNALAVVAGASGAVFGIYGALLAVAIRQRNSMPPGIAPRLARAGLKFVVYNLIYSFSPGISLAAHVGGFFAGLACGLFPSQASWCEEPENRSLRVLMPLAFGAVLVVAGSLAANDRYPHLRELQELFSQFKTLDAKDAKAFDAVRYKTFRQGMNDAEFAGFVERDVLPKWHNTRELLAHYEPVPQPLARKVEAIVQYMSLREQSCALIIEGLREQNAQKIKEASHRRDQAMEAKRTTT
jgi:rhomboid protease GluP